MDLHATAKLPDGTDSRGAWWAWTIAGFFAGGMIANSGISSAILLEAIVGIATGGGGSPLAEALSWLLWLVVPVAIGLPLGWLAAVLHKRMLMPREVWLTLSAMPALVAVLLLVFRGWDLALSAVVPVLAVSIGWFFMNWLNRRREPVEQAHRADAVS